MKKQIANALGHLVGLPLWASGRAANLAWFQFGERHISVGRNGKARQLGTWSLHLQTCWRIRDAGSIFVASRDIFYPGSEYNDTSEEFNWDVPGCNLHDEKIAAFFAGKGDLLIVTGVTVDSFGGFSLELEGGHFLEVFPDATVPQHEYWRLFRSASEASHFVVTSEGVEH